jgi:hypothetical protein
MVDTKLGFYGFIIATLMTLILTNIVTNYHRNQIEPFTSEIEEKESLSGNNNFNKYSIFLLFIASGIILVYGSMINSFNFNYTGMAG